MVIFISQEAGNKAMNRKLVWTAIDTLEIKEEPIPEAPPTGVIVKVCYAGLCHTHLHIYDNPGAVPPQCMPRVLETDAMEVGDRVVAFTWGGCLECPACVAGYNTICSNKHGPLAETYGVWNDGGYQQYLEVRNPWRLVKVPAGVDMALSSIVPCSGISALTAIDLCRPTIDRSIQIKGHANVLGNGAAALCLWLTEHIKALYGNKVKLCATDIVEAKLEDARARGADLTLCLPRDGTVEEAAGAIRAQFGGEGVDAAIDFVSSSTTQQNLFSSLADGGIQVYVGGFDNKLASLSLPSLVIQQKQLQGCYAGTKQQVIQVLDMVAKGQVKGPPISIIRFEDIEQTMKNMLAGLPYRGRHVAEMFKP